MAPPTFEDTISQSSLTLSGHGIYFECGHEELKTVFEVDYYGINVNGIIQQNNKLIGDCVARSGTESHEGTGTWQVFRVDFGVKYAKEPFVNVMPITLFSNENIAFSKFIGDKFHGYTGFEYTVYCEDPKFSYETKWFAVGNIMQ